MNLTLMKVEDGFCAGEVHPHPPPLGEKNETETEIETEGDRERQKERETESPPPRTWPRRLRPPAVVLWGFRDTEAREATGLWFN